VPVVQILIKLQTRYNTATHKQCKHVVHDWSLWW